jgi:hypothetical protein
VMARFAEAIETARVDVVPKIVVGGGSPNGAAGGSSLLEALLAIVLSDKLGNDVRNDAPAAPELDQLRTGIRRSLMSNLRGSDGAGPAKNS